MLSRKIAMLIGLAFLLAACSQQSGIKVEQAQIDQIQKGVTTRAEIESKLGKPTSSFRLSDNTVQVSYIHSESHQNAANFIPGADLFAGGIQSKTESLNITYDANGVVKDYRIGENNMTMNGGRFNHQDEFSSSSE